MGEYPGLLHPTQAVGYLCSMKSISLTDFSYTGLTFGSVLFITGLGRSQQAADISLYNNVKHF